MSDFVIRYKPDDISWEDLAECQRLAHESNKASGVNMQCANYTAAQLFEEVKDGFTLVAQDPSSRLMGMLSVVFNKVNRWWHKGTAAYICFVAVSPEFKGRGVYGALSKKASEIIMSKGVQVEYLNTHYGNESALRVYSKDGYKCVRFSPGSGTDYYSIEMAKWINGHGKSDLLCKMVFSFTRIAVKVLYKPGKIRRF